jgi:hypothetical protein
MNRIQKYVSYAAMSLVAIGATSSAWADCALPNFAGGYTAYITSVTPGSTPTLGWARCKVVVNDLGTITGTNPCKTSVGVDATLSAAKLRLLSGPGCEFSATFKVTVGPVVGSYSANSITLADDHLTAKGVGAFTQAGKTTGFAVDMVRLN